LRWLAALSSVTFGALMWPRSTLKKFSWMERVLKPIECSDVLVDCE